MKPQKFGIVLFSAAALFLLIVDSQTAAAGVREGLELCIRTLIPSLFPFFVVSNLLTSMMMESTLTFLKPLGKLCKIDSGCESLLAVGFLGGYPVGAQNIAMSLRSGAISETTAKRMMAFCNNAGPAFLFGIVGTMFPSKWSVLLIWTLHIAGAVLVSFIIPRNDTEPAKSMNAKPMNLSRLMEQSIKTMAIVCGWVVLFRLMLHFLDKWILLRISAPGQVLLSGILELSNGCVQLSAIDNEGLRFVICSVMLAFGGLCVTIQTFSLCQGCDMTYYFPGKTIQSIFCFLMSYFTQLIVFPHNCIRLPSVVLLMPAGALLLIIYFLRKNKISCSNSAPIGV